MIVEWGSWDGSYVEKDARDIIIDEIIKNKFCFSGNQHQYSMVGAPKIDGNIYGYSQRGWGGIMADAWNKIEKTNNYDYCSFAWGIPIGLELKFPQPLVL